MCLAGAVGDVSCNIDREPAYGGELSLVIKDGPAFLRETAWREFTSRGGRIAVVEPIRLLAVVVDPTAVTGTGFEPTPFLRWRKRPGSYPVIMWCGPGVLGCRREVDKATTTRRALK